MSSKKPRAAMPRGRGAVAISFALLLIVLIGFIGLALDLGMFYNRQAQLQSVADAAALAAARQLTGNATGIANALGKASTTVAGFYCGYFRGDGEPGLGWDNAAIHFSSAASGAAWVDAAAAAAAPAGLRFVRVDTAALDLSCATVPLLFMRVLPGVAQPGPLSARAVAGHSSMRITPLALCAMSAQAAASRSNPAAAPVAATVELVEYGFRRGVGYNLMQLNPIGTTPLNFLVDPIDPPGSAGVAANSTAAVAASFVCAGSLAMPSVAGAPIHVSSPFPLATLYPHLNARFGTAGSNCNSNGAPPDFNVRSYTVAPAQVPWMSASPAGQGAATLTEASALRTVADPAPAPAGTTAAMYGPLWSYAKAVQFSSYTANNGIEPAAGYTPFAVASWASLYGPAAPAASAYPSNPPYLASPGNGNFQAAAAAVAPGVRQRRVLNLPLLACPVAAGANQAATVLAIGRFFMTVPASATSLWAEFAGVVPEQALAGPVELFP